MFSRIVKYIVLLLLVVAVAIWFAENPGLVTLEWQGLIIDVPIALALVAILVVIGICALLYRLYVAIRRSPKIFGHYRAEQKTHKGYEALSKGMVAVAAGDLLEARKYATKAENLLKDPSLTMLLSAQAAQMDGDDQAANRFFETMSKTKGMEFLGLRGLLNQAIAKEDREEALNLAQKAYLLKPKTKWLADLLMELQLEKGHWGAAELTLDQSIRNDLIKPADGNAKKAALMIERAKEAETQGQLENAIKLLTTALKLDKSKEVISIRLATLLGKTNKRRKAIGVIEEAWAHHPHPELYDLYADMHAESDVLKRVQLAEKLAAKARDHVESRIIIAKAALEAQLWGEARDELKVLLKEAPSARVFDMMAQLVETENGDMTQAREWLRRAAHAQANPAWVCDACGQVSQDWSAMCGKCDGFDTKSWKSPSFAQESDVSRISGSGELVSDTK